MNINVHYSKANSVKQ